MQKSPLANVYGLAKKGDRHRERGGGNQKASLEHLPEQRELVQRFFQLRRKKKEGEPSTAAKRGKKDRGGLSLPAIDPSVLSGGAREGPHVPFL